MVKNRFHFFVVWFFFNLLIYVLSSPLQEHLVALTLLNVAQVVSLVGLFVTRSKLGNAIFGSFFIISNHLIIKTLDPFPSGFGILVSLASSLIAVVVLTNIKKEGK